MVPVYYDSLMNRAGFWRRFGALLLDAIIILIPLQIIVIILFAQTNGAVQGTFGFTTTSCYEVSALPEGFKLDPPPPADFNSFVDCHRGLPGFDMSRWLLASKSTKDGAVTTTEFRAYGLGPDGVPRSGFPADGPAILILLVYLVLMEYWHGATLGKRAVKIRAVDSNEIPRTGLPFRKALLRNLAMWIGSIPGIVIGVISIVRSMRPETSVSDLVPWLVIGGIIQLAWILWIIISASQKNDPIYDRLVGTAVVRM